MQWNGKKALLTNLFGRLANSIRQGLLSKPSISALATLPGQFRSACHDCKYGSNKLYMNSQYCRQNRLISLVKCLQSNDYSALRTRKKSDQAHIKRNSRLKAMQKPNQKS